MGGDDENMSLILLNYYFISNGVRRLSKSYSVFLIFNNNEARVYHARPNKIKYLLRFC